MCFKVLQGDSQAGGGGGGGRRIAFPSFMEQSFSLFFPFLSLSPTTVLYLHCNSLRCKQKALGGGGVNCTHSALPGRQGMY